MKIPVSNIYYLLCYAWNKLDAQQFVAVDAESCDTLPELFARVLHGGVSHLLKKGLDRDYLEHEEALAGIRGKIDFSSSVKQNLFIRQRAICRYDDLSYNILHNQILKTTVGRLMRLKELDKDWGAKLHVVYGRFHEVSTIALTSQTFKRVKIHRNNQFYEFLMRICELLYHSLLPTEQAGQYKFIDFTKDDDKMANVFEEFVRKFYQHEQKEYQAKRENITWQYNSSVTEANKLLPKMETDISLRKPGRLIIMECKYYRDVFDNRYGQDKYRSGHFYQVYAYLTQSRKIEKLDTAVSGILLYATGYDLEPQIYSRPDEPTLYIRGLNLTKHWSEVRRELLGLMGLGEGTDEVGGGLAQTL